MKVGFIVSGIISLLITAFCFVIAGVCIFLSFSVYNDYILNATDDIGGQFGKILYGVYIAVLIIIAIIGIVVGVFQLISAAFKLSIIRKKKENITSFKLSIPIIIFDILFVIISGVAVIAIVSNSRTESPIKALVDLIPFFVSAVIIFSVNLVLDIISRRLIKKVIYENKTQIQRSI
ncbi:MAG: hypothetical protein LBV51_02190 [Acholeplasmatales bacterium]|nr:hypothetical protein [Acholeplasmatales bacterium]